VKSVLEIIRERTKGLRLLFAGNVLVSILSSVSYMVLTMAIQLIIAVASKETPYSLSGVALFAVGALAYWAVMSIFSEIIGGHLEINVEKKIRSGIMETLFRKTVLSVHTMNTGEITIRLTEDVRNISDFIVGISGRIIVAIFTSALAIIYMFILSWQMALIMVIMVPVLTVIISVFAPVLQKLAAENLGDEDSVKSLFQDVLAHLNLFKVYRMDSEMDAALDARYKKKRSSRIKLAKFRGVFMFLDNFMSFGVLIITLVIGAYFALKGQIGISKLITIVQLTNYTSWPLSNFSQWVAQFATVRASTDRIDEIENLEDESERAKLDDNCVPERILLSDIAFTYDKEKFILKKYQPLLKKVKLSVLSGKVE
jgi:ABC-type multidrug transport system, ATPase and permease components